MTLLSWAIRPRAIPEIDPRFASQEPAADQNGDGVFDFFDVSAFLSTFTGGCL